MGFGRDSVGAFGGRQLLGHVSTGWIPVGILGRPFAMGEDMGSGTPYHSAGVGIYGGIVCHINGVDEEFVDGEFGAGLCADRFCQRVVGKAGDFRACAEKLINPNRHRIRAFVFPDIGWIISD